MSRRKDCCAIAATSRKPISVSSPRTLIIRTQWQSMSHLCALEWDGKVHTKGSVHSKAMYTAAGAEEYRKGFAMRLKSGSLTKTVVLERQGRFVSWRHWAWRYNIQAWVVGKVCKHRARLKSQANNRQASAH